MVRLARERLPFALALAAACAVGPAAVLHFLAREPAGFSAGAHFTLVAISGLGAGAAAIALTVVGARRQDAVTVLLGTAFSTMTALLAVHGLATPGILTGSNGVVAFAGGASLPVGGALLALAALPELRGPGMVRRLLILQVVLITGVVGLGSVGLLIPGSVPGAPVAGTGPAMAVLVVGLVFFGILTARAAATFRLTLRRSDLLVVVGTVWLGVALVPQLTMSPMSLAFYVGHLLELLGIACIGVPLALDLYRTAASRPLAGDLHAVELVRSEEAFLGARVRSLLIDLERKDSSTEQHTRRVALLAVQVGEQLGLAPARMRALAVGGLLHDMGKLAVPDAVLQKTSSLTSAEFAEIKRHPEAGHALLTDLGGFPRAVRRLVLDHHERLDGHGYPRGLHAENINLETRILTVCDVYDALVSDRVYRTAWRHEDALALLRDQTGTAFDRRSVAALISVIGYRSTDLEPPMVAMLASPDETPTAARAQRSAVVQAKP